MKKKKLENTGNWRVINSLTKNNVVVLKGLPKNQRGTAKPWDPLLLLIKQVVVDKESGLSQDLGCGPYLGLEALSFYQ